MIPIGLVKSGYLDDLKKELALTPDSTESTPTVAGAKARAVVSTWRRDDAAWTETALVLVHGDHVYILRTRHPAAKPAAGDAFDQMVRNLQW